MQQSIEHYDELLTNIQNLVNQDTTKFKELGEDVKYTRIVKFHQSLQNSDLFLLFSKSKLKLFSGKTEETHNVSCSLFDTNPLDVDGLTLKKCFNNMPDNVKNSLWENLFCLYIDIEKTQEVVSNDRVTVLIDNIKEYRSTVNDTIKNNLFNVDVNNTTNNMLNDIIGSLQDFNGKGENPFDNIMNIATKITGKYQDQLQSGDIQLDSLLGGMTNMIPNLIADNGNNATDKKQPIIIDEKFSTSNVNLGKEEESKPGMLPGMLPQMTGLIDMVGRLNTAESKEDLASIKKDMDSYLEKELKVDMVEFKQTMGNLEEKLEEAIESKED